MENNPKNNKCTPTQQYYDSPVHLFISGKIPCPVRLFYTVQLLDIVQSHTILPTAEILSGKNARAWVSMVLYLKN